MVTLSPAGSLRMVSGAVVWALHFTAIYVFAALACARGFADVRWWGIGVVPLAIGAATALALGALIVIVVRALKGRGTTLRATRFGAHSRLGAVTRAAGEGPYEVGIDGQCEPEHEADSKSNNTRCGSKEAEALRANARDGFNAQITAGVAALAGVAIVWETFPALMVPGCA